MTTEEMIKNLKRVEERYRDKVFPVGEISTFSMAWDCRVRIEELQETLEKIKKYITTEHKILRPFGDNDEYWDDDGYTHGRLELINAIEEILGIK